MDICDLSDDGNLSSSELSDGFEYESDSDDLDTAGPDAPPVLSLAEVLHARRQYQRNQLGAPVAATSSEVAVLAADRPRSQAAVHTTTCVHCGFQCEQRQRTGVGLVKAASHGQNFVLAAHFGCSRAPWQRLAWAKLMNERLGSRRLGLDCDVHECVGFTIGCEQTQVQVQRLSDRHKHPELAALSLRASSELMSWYQQALYVALRSEQVATCELLLRQVPIPITATVPPQQLVQSIKFDPMVRHGHWCDWFGNRLPLDMHDFRLQLTCVQVACRMCTRPGDPAVAMLELMWETCAPTSQNDAKIWLESLELLRDGLNWNRCEVRKMVAACATLALGDHQGNEAAEEAAFGGD